MYLIEAKWHKNPLAASSIYSFKGKVDGKLIGTIGVFISMSDYSNEAPDALALGKTLNIILFNKSDIEIALSGEKMFVTVLQAKLRAAAEYGIINFDIKLEREVDRQSNKISSEDNNNWNQPIRDLTIIVEGLDDKFILQTLINKILQKENPGNIKIVTASGKLNVPRVAQFVRDNSSSLISTLIVVDGDSDPQGTLAMVRNFGFDQNQIIIPDPSIETWLGMENNTTKSEFYRQIGIQRTDLVSLKNFISNIDISELVKKDQSFNIFRETILNYKNISA